MLTMRLSTPIMAVLVFAAPLASCAPDPDKQFEQARSAYVDHNYPAARLYLVSALKERPNDPKMLLLQARTMLALGDGNGAGIILENLNKAKSTKEIIELSAEAALLRKSPETALDALGTLVSPEAERLRALAALQKLDMAGAEQHFARSITLGGNSRAFADFARFRMIKGDVEGAQDMLARAVRAEAGGLDTLLVAGDFAVRKGDLKKALDAFAEASRSYPASIAAKTGEAAVLGDLGRFDEMDKIVGQLTRQGVGGLDLSYLKARSALAKKQWSMVRDIIQPIEADVPKLHPLRVINAEALVHLGNPEQAITTLLPIVRAQPGNRQSALILARAQEATGNHRGAVATLRSIADSPQARPEELALMAQAAKAAGDPAAPRYAARASRMIPQVLGGDLAEADAAMREQNWARAAVAYDRILSATDGKAVLVLNNMAHAQLMLGNNRRAAEFAQRALKLAPDDASVLDTAGWVMFKSGQDLAEAKRLLRIAAEKAPENATIKRHLAEASSSAS